MAMSWSNKESHINRQKSSKKAQKTFVIHGIHDTLCFLNKKIVKPFFVPPNARTVLVHVTFGDVLDVVRYFDQGVVFYDSPGPGL